MHLCNVRMSLETSAVYKDVDHSARMLRDVRLFCMRVETLKARCIFILSCISFRDKNLEKIYKLDGCLTAYCLILANPNIHQNTGNFFFFLKQT